MKTDLEIVNAATPGPWDYYLEQGYEGHGVIITYTEDEKGFRHIGQSVFKRIITSEENKLFIAHFNPSKVNKRKENMYECNNFIDSCGIGFLFCV